MRIVPDQKLEQIVDSFNTFVKNAFESLQSQNILTVQMGKRADWWLADFENDKYYKAAEYAVERVKYESIF